MSMLKSGAGAVVRRIPPRALQINDFCEAYGLGRSKTFALIREGKLPSVMVAGRRLIPVDAAEKLIAVGSR